MIKLIDVYKSFGSKKVLEGFSLEVDEGETMALIGYSGSGKSVAIKHIVGLLEPDRGTAWVDNQEVPKLSRVELYALRSHIGYVFQFAALFDSLTICDNVAMGLRKEGRLSEHDVIKRVGEALELVVLPVDSEIHRDVERLYRGTHLLGPPVQRLHFGELHGARMRRGRQHAARPLVVGL